MAKTPDPVAIAEAAVQAAIAELQAAESALAALRERETAAGLAVTAARLACEAAEAARAEAIRAALTAGTDPAAAARASQAERLRLAAEADDLTAVCEAIVNGIPVADARRRAARDAVDAAEIGLLLARLPGQIVEARAALPAVLRAWRTRCTIAGMPMPEPGAFWRFVAEELALPSGGVEAVALGSPVDK